MSKISSVVALLIALTCSVTCDEYEDNIKFMLYNKGNSSISTFNTSMSAQGCDMGGKFAIIAHGWMGSNSPWTHELIKNLLNYRQGCVLFMNYSEYSDHRNYFQVIQNFNPIAKLLTRKLRQIVTDGASSDNIFMFGHSLGGRIVIEAGLQFGHKRIGLIDSCEPAGPGFDVIYTENPMNAAKNVQCIHTSLMGTLERKCHQNWLMGNCGTSQPAGNDVGAVLCSVLSSCSNSNIMNHRLCPHFYNLAFTNDFLADTNNRCRSNRIAKNLPPNFKMGYLEYRRNASIVGDIPCPTFADYPYTGRQTN